MLKYEHRTISNPTFESSVKGTQEAFNEVLNINTALIRKYVNIRKSLALGLKALMTFH